MSYEVAEIFYSLQGEGLHAGRSAVFCRFARCNLWSGEEADRPSSPCWFCDTDFLRKDGQLGGTYPGASQLADVIYRCWHTAVCTLDAAQQPYVVFTGGEPLLQLDDHLLKHVKAYGFCSAVETNGTIPAPSLVDWITVSPKANTPLIQQSGNELKLPFPQEDIDPACYLGMNFEYFFLLPIYLPDPQQTAENTRLALAYCLANPPWRLTGQAHKLWNIA